jgi:hypothetical protein
MPAHFALTAIPVQAGRHRLRLESRAPAFRGGWFLTALSALAACSAAAAVNRR